MGDDYIEKDFDDEVYEDDYYEEHYNEEELTDLDEFSDEDDDLDDNADDEDDEKPGRRERKIHISYACEDCDYRWDDIIIKKKDEIDDDLDRDVICPMCGSVNITLI